MFPILYQIYQFFSDRNQLKIYLKIILSVKKKVDRLKKKLIVLITNYSYYSNKLLFYKVTIIWSGSMRSNCDIKKNLIDII